MAKQDWKMAFIVLVCVMAGFFLAGSGILSSAHGQSEGQAGGVICVVGEERNGFAPIVLVDVPDQTVLVYEYSYANDRIELTSARTFKWDRRLMEYNTRGPTFDEVRLEVESRR